MSTPSLYPVVTGKQVYVASTGVAATDTAALQAAHDSFPSTGGTIALNTGPYALTQNGLSFTKPVHLLGTGPNGSHPANDAFFGIGTLINCDSTTGNAITSTADGVTFEKLYIKNTHGAAPSAGAGIQFASPSAGRSSFRMIDCCIDGFFYCVDCVSGFYWIMDRCFITNPVKFGLKIADVDGFDAGDQIVTATTFTPGPFTTGAGGSSQAIAWASGGGLRLTNCKVNNSSATANFFNVAVGCSVVDGCTTADLFFCNNSLENVDYGLIINQAGTSGIVSQIIVADNEFLVNTLAISIAPGTGTFDDIQIHGNVGTASLSLANVTNVRLHGQNFTTAGRPSASVMAPGSWYYDSTLHKPGFADGSGNWKDAAGTNI